MRHTFDFTGIAEAEVQQLIKEFTSKLEYISSGARDRYEARRKLENHLQDWARVMVREIKEVTGARFRNTNYSSHELNIWKSGSSYMHGMEIYVPYTIRDEKFNTVEDFSFSLGTRAGGKYTVLGSFKTSIELNEALYLYGIKQS